MIGSGSSSHKCNWFVIVFFFCFMTFFCLFVGNKNMPPPRRLGGNAMRHKKPPRYSNMQPNMAQVSMLGSQSQASQVRTHNLR